MLHLEGCAEKCEKGIYSPAAEMSSLKQERQIEVAIRKVFLNRMDQPASCMYWNWELSQILPKPLYELLMPDSFIPYKI